VGGVEGGLAGTQAATDRLLYVIASPLVMALGVLDAKREEL
jgi:hypothetical protein